MGQDFTAVRIYAAFGSNLTVFIDFKFPICPSNFTFRCIQGCFGSTIVIITACVEAVFIHGSTVLAYFDSIFAEGNLVFAIFIQHQFIHSRGCGAVVSGDFGNHTVPIYFEVILVGRFAGILFSRNFLINFRFCVCIGNAISFQGRCFICLFIQGRVNFGFRVRISNAVACQVCRLICFSIQGSIGFCFRVHVRSIHTLACSF